MPQVRHLLPCGSQNTVRVTLKTIKGSNMNVSEHNCYRKYFYCTVRMSQYEYCAEERTVFMKCESSEVDLQKSEYTFHDSDGQSGFLSLGSVAMFNVFQALMSVFLLYTTHAVESK